MYTVWGSEFDCFYNTRGHARFARIPLVVRLGDSWFHLRQGWKKSKFSEWPAEFSVISSDKSKNFLFKKFLKILQNGGAQGGSKPFMRELLPP